MFLKFLFKLIINIQADESKTDEGHDNDEEDVSKDRYGSYGLIRSTERKELDFKNVKDLNSELNGKEVS